MFVWFESSVNYDIFHRCLITKLHKFHLFTLCAFYQLTKFQKFSRTFSTGSLILNFLFFIVFLCWTQTRSNHVPMIIKIYELQMISLCNLISFRLLFSIRDDWRIKLKLLQVSAKYSHKMYQLTTTIHLKNKFS